MKKFSLLICFLWFSLIGFRVVASIEKMVTATVVEPTIFSSGLPVNQYLERPLLSYDDYTYISLRDHANLTYKDIEWDEEYETITLLSQSQEDCIVTSTETAQKIGEAILEENFPDILNEDTRYVVYEFRLNHKGARNGFSMYVFTDPSLDLEEISLNYDQYADIKMTIYSDTGECFLKKLK